MKLLMPGMKSSVAARLGLVFGAIIFFTISVSYVYLGGHLRDLFFQGLKTDLKRISS